MARQLEKRVRREELLQPSLSHGTAVLAPYSTRVTFFTAFFGGPIAALGILTVNSIRLRRLRRDLPALLLLCALMITEAWVLYSSATGSAVREWLGDSIGKANVQFIDRIIALAIVGAGYLLHRREQRRADLTGATRPNGWIPGLACIAAGISLVALMIAVTNSQ